MAHEPEALFDLGYSALNIPFELDQAGKVYIRGQVSEGKNLRILLDTGVATMFVLERQWAERLNLKLTEGYQVQGSGADRSAAALAKDISVKLPGVTLVHINAITMPVYKPDPGEERDAILGFDFFRNFIVEVDYDTKLINVYDTRAYSYKGTGDLIPVRIVENLAYINARVRFPHGEPIEAQFHLDSGSGTAVHFYYPFVNEHRLFEKFSNLVEGSTVGEGGEVKTAFATAESVEVGSIKHASPLVGLEVERGGSLPSKIAAGSLGAEVLHSSKVIFDIPHNRIIMERKISPRQKRP